MVNNQHIINLRRIYALLPQVSQLVGVSQMELKNQIKEALDLETFSNLSPQNTNQILQFLINTKNDYNTNKHNTNEPKTSTSK